MAASNPEKSPTPSRSPGPRRSQRPMGGRVIRWFTLLPDQLISREFNFYQLGFAVLVAGTAYWFVSRFLF